MAKHQRDQEASDAAIAVQKRVNGFKLHMGEGRFYNWVGRFVQVLLEIRETGIQMSWRCRHKSRIARPRASDPILGATEFAGLLLCAAPISEQDAVASYLSAGC